MMKELLVVVDDKNQKRKSYQEMKKEGLTRLNIDIDADLWKRVKIASVEQDEYNKEFLELALEERLNRLKEQNYKSDQVFKNENIKRLNVDINAELWKRVKIASIEQDEYHREFVERALEERLNRFKK